MQSFLKIYLPVYLLVYFTVVFVWPSYRIWKRTGINPVRFKKEDTAHHYAGFVMKLLILLTATVVFVFSVSDQLYTYFVPIWYMEQFYIKTAGLILIHAAFVWIVTAQIQMNESWRIGIDTDYPAALVTRGLFKISRNPVFAGMIAGQAGLFMLLPGALTLCLLVTTYVILQLQIRLEEGFLEQQHGEDYKMYKTKTRRLL